MQKPALPDNLVPAEFTSKFGGVIHAVLAGFDRLRWCGSLRPLFTPNGMYAYLCAAKVLLRDFAEHAPALTDEVCQAARQAAERAGRPYLYLYLRSSQVNKEDCIEQIVRRDRINEGLIAVLSAVEPCLAITVRKRPAGQALNPRGPRAQMPAPL
jgi:hypothetical protein